MARTIKRIYARYSETFKAEAARVGQCNGHLPPRHQMCQTEVSDKQLRWEVSDEYYFALRELGG